MSKNRALRRNAPQGYMHGFAVAYNGAASLTCGAGYCRDALDTFDIKATAMPNFDISLTGAGGRRSGLVEASSTYYHCFVIADSRGVNAPSSFIDDSLTPALPTGYDLYRRLYTVRNDGSSNFRSTNMVKQAGSMREIHWRYSDGSARFLSGGAAVAFTSIDVQDWMPPTAVAILITAKVSASNQGSFAQFRSPLDSSISSPPMFVWGGDSSTGSGDGGAQYTIPTATRAIEYLVSGATCDGYCIGYIDQL